uniref:Uncharacterized protein n=1 Tax=Cacopsylla melanoneura TaxID=428564 RepID=A0A8D8VV75_9HEMI
MLSIFFFFYVAPWSKMTWYNNVKYLCICLHWVSEYLYCTSTQYCVMAIATSLLGINTAIKHKMTVRWGNKMKCTNGTKFYSSTNKINHDKCYRFFFLFHLFISFFVYIFMILS